MSIIRTDILDRENEIRTWIENNKSKAFMCKELNCKPVTLDGYLKQMNIEYHGIKHAGGIKYVPYAEYIKRDYYTTSRVKEKLIKEGLKEDVCEECGCPAEWNGRPLSLELHHIDGNSNNNELSNLKILCPNCHQQTDNFRGKNTAKAKTNKKIKYACKDCGRGISKRGTRCVACANKHEAKSRENAKPEKAQLINELKEKSFLQIGKDHGVSDNAVRKWCKSYGLPVKASEIKALTVTDWNELKQAA